MYYFSEVRISESDTSAAVPFESKQFRLKTPECVGFI